MPVINVEAVGIIFSFLIHLCRTVVCLSMTTLALGGTRYFRGTVVTPLSVTTTNRKQSTKLPVRISPIILLPKTSYNFWKFENFKWRIYFKTFENILSFNVTHLWITCICNWERKTVNTENYLCSTLKSSWCKMDFLLLWIHS